VTRVAAKTLSIALIVGFFNMDVLSQAGQAARSDFRVEG